MYDLATASIIRVGTGNVGETRIDFSEFSCCAGRYAKRNITGACFIESALEALWPV